MPPAQPTGSIIVQAVPRVSAFYGVVIYMYWNERNHPVPSMPTIQVAGPQFPRTVPCLPVASSIGRFCSSGEWASLHRAEIVANWERARKSEPLLNIAPLP
jgi:hypothetical protein